MNTRYQINSIIDGNESSEDKIKQLKCLKDRTECALAKIEIEDEITYIFNDVLLAGLKMHESQVKHSMKKMEEKMKSNLIVMLALIAGGLSLLGCLELYAHIVLK